MGTLLAALLAGCVQVGPKQLPEMVPMLPRGNQACPELPDLPPIPETVHIAIEPGKTVQADAGGRALLRAYIEQRERAARR